MRLSPHLPDNTWSFTFVLLAAFFVAIAFQIGMGVLTRLTKRPKAKGVNNGCVPGCDGGGRKVMDDLSLSYVDGFRLCIRRYTKKARALYSLLMPLFRLLSKVRLAYGRATH